MNDEPDTEPQAQFFTFGLREPEVMRIDPTDLCRFIMGLEVAVTDELLAAIRAELGAMERYRLALTNAVAKVCAATLAGAFESAGPIEHPVTDVHSAFWRGYALGKYEAYCNAAAELSEIPVVAALALEEPRT